MGAAYPQAGDFGKRTGCPRRHGGPVRWDCPNGDASEFDWLAFEQSGVLTRTQAEALLGRHPVHRHLELGRWRTICRNLLLTHNGPMHPEQQLWVAVLTAGPGALLAGRSSATAGGVVGLRREPIQVLIPAPRNRTGNAERLPPDMPEIQIFRTARLPQSHCRTGRPPRTTQARSVVDAAAWAEGDDEARTIVVSACQQRRVTPEEIGRVLDVFPRIKRHRLIARTIADIAGGALSLAEVDFVTLCRKFELPAPKLQQRRRDAAGRNRFLDAYWPEFRLHVEVDGAYHVVDEQWAADMIRQNDVWIKGDRILRFPASLIRSRPDVVALQLQQAMNAAARS
ncbi:hypothetical protein [Actinoplanes sp. NPDC023714]|uniref:endonuclease domain-containing protein n=1 Tax=Actinoplanes sp. NPDC023714 TaxID=3154322 RepID=UPI0033C53EC1